MPYHRSLTKSLYKQEEEARNRCGSELSVSEEPNWDVVSEPSISSFSALSSLHATVQLIKWKPFIPAVEPRAVRTNTRDTTADQEQAGQQLSFRRRSDHGTRAGDREHGQGGEVARASRAARMPRAAMRTSRVCTPSLGAWAERSAAAAAMHASVVRAAQSQRSVGGGGCGSGWGTAYRAAGVHAACYAHGRAVRYSAPMCGGNAFVEWKIKRRTTSQNWSSTVSGRRVNSAASSAIAQRCGGGKRNVSDLPLYVRDFSDVSDFMIFDTQPKRKLEKEEWEGGAKKSVLEGEFEGDESDEQEDL
ncbi:hypothetical protein GGX14DRAFT_401046 [Mycena pura]|uniref:Uncharacterized protein n=1 Tax=Mycena pura TaxID=153505 RepID=A0AAD6V0H1_9AGAR|nr:hypothetical protein GGX14DRAFT_401046 [Mycena pura]